MAVGLDPAVRGGSRLACQRQLGVEENSWGIGSSPAGGRIPLVGTPLGAETCVQSRMPSDLLLASWVSLASLSGSQGPLGCLCPRTMTKWFYPTRLETRTKESSICASSWVLNLEAQ